MLTSEAAKGTKEYVKAPLLPIYGIFFCVSYFA